jgi:hypothetical protein
MKLLAKVIEAYEQVKGFIKWTDELEVKLKGIPFHIDSKNYKGAIEIHFFEYGVGYVAMFITDHIEKLEVRRFKLSPMYADYEVNMDEAEIRKNSIRVAHGRNSDGSMEFIYLCKDTAYYQTSDLYHSHISRIDFKIWHLSMMFDRDVE